MRGCTAGSLLVGWVVTALSCPVRAEVADSCAGCAAPPGLSLEAAYSGELWRQASGGLHTGGRYLDNLNITATADGRAWFGLEGLTLFGNVLYNNGRVLNDELAGSAQGVSNIETLRAVRLYELWGEWSFGARHSLRAGLYDLNSEFDSIEAAGLFIQPSQGIGADFSQSGVNGPSIFPSTSLAVRAKRTVGSWSLQAAVLDAVPGDPNHPRRTRVKLSNDEGALLVAEVRHNAGGTQVTAGYWQYTSSFADLESGTDRHDNAGMYLSVAGPKLFAGPEGQGLDVYVRAGRAEAHINPIEQYLGAGAVYSGLFAADGTDQLGVSVGVARLGAPHRRAQADLGTPTTQHEHAWELTYRVNLTDWLALQPDVQYIRHPGMNPALDDCWLFGVRFDVSRAWSR